MKDTIAASVCGFRLPAYDEIPNVGLYLEQTVKYIEEYVRPLGDVTITGSMVSNYVKMKLIPNPVRKQYGRDQIALLFFIAVAKNVVSLENIRVLLETDAERDARGRYEEFRLLLEGAVRAVFEGADDVPEEEGNSFDPMMRRMVGVAASKSYLNKCFAGLMG